MDGNGRVRQILIKPFRSNLRNAWVIAVWTPAFTQFMHDHLFVFQETREPGNDGNNVSKQRELSMGDVIQASIEHNLKIESVLFPECTSLDIGTSDDLVKAVRNLNTKS